jgi:hypothetical protein
MLRSKASRFCTPFPTRLMGEAPRRVFGDT